MPLKVIRKVCMVLLPALMLGSLILHFYFPLSTWTNAFYTISLTANIGYFTNYVAIKMLFRPHYKTAFGRQGLIPKNQDKLAESLSHTLIENFLSKQQWQEYLAHSDLVNKVLAEAKSGTRDWLSKEQNYQLIKDFIQNYLEQNEQTINGYFNQVQKELVNELASDFDVQDLLSHGFEWLEDQFEQNPAQMHKMIEPIIKTIAENIPNIAYGLSNALDAHIEEQDTLKRGIAKMAKWSADFNTDDIKRYLFRLVASFEFRETLFEGLKTLISEYKNKPMLDSNLVSSDDQSNIQLSFPAIVDKLVTSNLGQINWAQVINKQIFAKQNNPDSSPDNALSTLLSLHKLIFEKIESELIDGPLHTWIIDELVSMIEKLDLRQLVKNRAKAFTPEKMESVFQKMISEQLVFIELLGALLGGLSGLALIDIETFIALAGFLGSYYALDYVLTKRRI